MAVPAAVARERDVDGVRPPTLCVPAPWIGPDVNLLEVHRLELPRGLVALQVTGELCAYSTPALVLHVERHAGSDVHLDLFAVDFIDVRAISLLLMLRHRWRSRGRTLVLANPSATVCRVVGILGLVDELFGEASLGPHDGRITV